MDVKVNEYFECETADDAFVHWYNELASMDCSSQSRDGDVVGEILNAVTVIKDPTRCLMFNDIRNMPMRYAIGELAWYLSGNRSLSEIQKFTKAWDRMSDDGQNVNSNYGWCIKYKYGFDQWEFVRNLLMEHPESRQAVIHIKTADNAISNDVNCTVSLQFFIRDEKLYMTVYMRSNDVWMGFPYDVFQFSFMQILMSMELGVGLGTYTHVAGSLHLYERNLKKDVAKDVVQ